MQLIFSALEMLFYFKSQVTSGFENSQKLNYRLKIFLHEICLVHHKNLFNAMSTVVMIVEKYYHHHIN